MRRTCWTLYSDVTNTWNGFLPLSVYLPCWPYIFFKALAFHGWLSTNHLWKTSASTACGFNLLSLLAQNGNQWRRRICPKRKTGILSAITQVENKLTNPSSSSYLRDSSISGSNSIDKTLSSNFLLRYSLFAKCSVSFSPCSKCSQAFLSGRFAFGAA